MLPASFSEIAILAAAGGAACALILVLLGIAVAVKYYKRKGRSPDIEMHPPEDMWKDSTVW